MVIVTCLEKLLETVFFIQTVSGILVNGQKFGERDIISGN